MRQALAILLAAAILGVIYWQIEVSALLAALAGIQGWWFALSFVLFVPMVVITAWRLQCLVHTSGRLEMAEANKLILAATTLNMVLPSHFGDLAKAYFLADRGHVSGSLALSLVVFERLNDLFALFLWCLVGLLLYPVGGANSWLLAVALAAGLGVSVALALSVRCSAPLFAALILIAPRRFKPQVAALEVAWRELNAHFRGDRRGLLKVAGLSVLNWFIHALQVWLFILALGAWAPFGANLVLAPLALLVGMLPVTFAGIGTRDAALIYFYAPFFPAAIGAALGLLCILRTLVPALAGLPFLSRYVAAIRARQAGPGGGVAG